MCRTILCPQKQSKRGKNPEINRQSFVIWWHNSSKSYVWCLLSCTSFHFELQRQQNFDLVITKEGPSFNFFSVSCLYEKVNPALNVIYLFNKKTVFVGWFLRTVMTRKLRLLNLAPLYKSFILESLMSS